MLPFLSRALRRRLTNPSLVQSLSPSSSFSSSSSSPSSVSCKTLNQSFYSSSSSQIPYACASTFISMWLSLSRAPWRRLTNPFLVQSLSPSSSFSSSSSYPSSAAPPGNDGASADPEITSFVKDVKASLKQEEGKRWTQNPTTPNSPPSRNPPYWVRPDDAPLQDFRKHLAEYKLRSSAPSPAAQGQQQPISFQKLYLQNVPAAEGDRAGGVSGSHSFDKIRASISSMGNRVGSDNRWAGRAQSSNPGSSLSRRPANDGNSTRPGGRTVGGSAPLFGQTLQFLGGGGFGKADGYKKLGEELKKLRPEQKQGQKGWFSLQELSERLSKLKELEKEHKSGLMDDVRSGLETLSALHEKINKPIEYAKGHKEIFSVLGGTPDFKSMTPKEHLVEKYFHPDNMSSQEKMKIELAKVREEFKMSESDCGSARVQVALLTTKIKHLSSVLHKKDKHSRKGLQEMVQKRKKLLRYLRRTDWDSYCIVLSKLGLRDNPDYKNL